jgi:hypothetical protein
VRIWVRDQNLGLINTQNSSNRIIENSRVYRYVKYKSTLSSHAHRSMEVDRFGLRVDGDEQKLMKISRSGCC